MPRGRTALVVKVLLSAGLLAGLLLLLPWNEVRDAAGRLPFGVWLAVLAGFCAGHALGVVKWRLLVNAANGGLSMAAAARCYAAGLFANLCLPSIVGGDVLRAALAAREKGRGEAAVLGGIEDRLCDVAALALLLALGGLASRTALPGWGGVLITAIMGTGIAAAVLALPLVWKRPLARWPKRLRRTVGRTLVGLRRLARAPGILAQAFAMSLTIQGAFVLLNAWIGAAIGIAVPLSVWFFAWPLAKFAGLLPISLGGLGVRDATFGALLVSFGVPLATGVVASLIWTSILIAGGLLAGGLWWLLRRSGPVDAGLKTRRGNRIRGETERV